MALIDEKLLENLWKRQDTNWRKPVEYKAKTLINRQLETDLDDTTVPDDVRAKQYQRNLNRFLHTSREQPIPEPIPPIAPLPKPPKIRIKQPDITPPPHSPRVKRERRKPEKLKWAVW
jgi:hypothetical protein